MKGKIEGPRMTSLKVYPHLCIFRRNQVPWTDIMDRDIDETESVDAVSTVSTEDEITRGNELDCLRQVVDIEKLNSPKPKTRWQAMREVEVSDLSQFALERFLEDRDTYEQLTVEEIEDDMGAARPWNYGNNPDWDWFVSKIRSPSVRDQLPHAYDMGEIKRSAITECNKTAMLGSSFMERFRDTFQDTSPCIDLTKFDSLDSSMIGAGDCVESHKQDTGKQTKVRAANKKRGRRSRKMGSGHSGDQGSKKAKGFGAAIRSLFGA